MERITRICLAERERWVLWLPVGMGIGIGWYFSLAEEPSPFLGFSGMAIGSTLAWRARRHPRILAGSVIFCTVMLGVSAAQWRTHSVRAPILTESREQQWMTGRLAHVEALERGSRMILEDLSIPGLPPDETPARIRINTFQNPQDIPYLAGEIISVRAQLVPPPTAPLPGAFDFARYAYFHQIGAVGYATSRLYKERAAKHQHDRRRVEEIAASQPYILARLRHHVTLRIQAAFSEPYGVIAAALLTGMKKGIPEEEIEAIRAAGIAHIMAISGLHLGLVAGLVFLAARFLCVLLELAGLPVSSKKTAALFALIGSGGYLLLSGMPVSAVRAWVMVALVLTAILLDRMPSPLYFVAWAATLILLLTPESLLHVGFQLSFAATLSLVALVEHVQRHGTPEMLARWRRRPLGRFANYVLGICLTSILTGLVTAPYSLYHFNEAHSYGLLSNLVAIPLTSFWVMPWGLGTLLLLPFSLESLAAVPMQWGLEALLGIAHWTAALPYATVRVPAFPIASVILTTLGGLWIIFWRQRWRHAGWVAVVLGMALTAWQNPPDLLIGREGKMIALRHEGGLSLLEGRRGTYVADIWLRQLGEADYAPFKDARCDGEGCVILHGGGTTILALPRTPDAFMEDCEQADVILAAFAPTPPCPSALVVNRAQIDAHGPHALWLEKNGRARLAHVAGGRGDREW